MPGLLPSLFACSAEAFPSLQKLWVAKGALGAGAGQAAAGEPWTGECRLL